MEMKGFFLYSWKNKVFEDIETNSRDFLDFLKNYTFKQILLRSNERYNWLKNCTTPNPGDDLLIHDSNGVDWTAKVQPINSIYLK